MDKSFFLFFDDKNDDFPETGTSTSLEYYRREGYRYFFLMFTIFFCTDNSTTNIIILLIIHKFSYSFIYDCIVHILFLKR